MIPKQVRSKGATAPEQPASRMDVWRESSVNHLMLVGGHTCFRQALGVLLGRERGLGAVAQAGTFSAARRMLGDRVDVAVVDTSLPDGQSVDLVRDIRRLNPSGAVLVLARDPGQAIQAVEAGADEILDKNVTAARIVSSVKRLATRSRQRPRKETGR